MDDRDLRRITRDELRAKLERGDDFALVDALAPMSFAISHLPHAINMPPDLVYELADASIPDRKTEIVVYCMDVDCDSSLVTIERLAELGYTNLRHYAEGKRDWATAGLPLEPPTARATR